ncbi:MAG: hypothetical protein BGO70_17785 [Bacteroidetes bacterium 43-93]|nr:hypothetical protein [Bacteroidota bacterium]OJX01593.1 MAG: hypothetical protein BGO70_17785 [Bacteroidetes bacterium 43-93]
MKTYLFTIILFCICYIHSATAQDARFFDYYRNTNLAELAICDSDFVKATEYYKAAFAINPKKSMYRDLTNAFFVAMDQAEYTLAEKYLAQLLQRGLDTESLEHITKAYSGDQWMYVSKMLAKHPNHRLDSDPLVKKLRKIYDRDQKVRDYFGNMNGGAYMVDSTYTMDLINSNELLKIFQTSGIPSESVLKFSHYDLIIYHNSGAALGGRPSHLFDTLLYKALFSFNFDPRDILLTLEKYAPSPEFIYDTLTLHFPLNVRGAEYQHVRYAGFWDEASEKRINEDRAKIGLESLDDVRRKIELENKGNDKNSIFHKYWLNPTWALEVFLKKEGLDKWLSENGKYAPIKPSVFNQKFVKPGPARFDIGIMSDDFVIGEKCMAAKLYEYNHNGCREYVAGKVTNKTWKNRNRTVGFVYCGEMIADPAENLQTDSGRNNTARFVPGYRILIDNGYGFYFGYLRDIEQLYDTDSSLIHLTAGVDTVFYRTMIKYIGAPTAVTKKTDTIPYPLDKKYIMMLHTRNYTWVKGNKNTVVTLRDELTARGKKITKATYQMMDIKRYEAYLQKVEEEKKRLDKLYAATKN